MKNPEQPGSKSLRDGSLEALRAALEKNFASMASPDPLITKEQKTERNLLKADATIKEIEERYRRGALLLLNKLHERCVQAKRY